LRQVQWANRHIWRKAPFAEYHASAKTGASEASDTSGQLQLEAVP